MPRAKKNRMSFFPFFPGDFVEATMTWTSREVGVYVRLLCVQWSDGSLDPDNTRLAMAVGLSPDDFEVVWELVSTKFPESPEGRQNPRLAAIREETVIKLGTKREQKRNPKGNKKGTKEEQKRNIRARARAGSGSGSTTTAPPKKKEEETSSKKKPDKYVPGSAPIPPSLATGPFLQAWAEWVAHKNEIKDPYKTERTEKMRLKQLGEMGAGRAIAAIEHSIAHGWKGIHEPDNGNGSATSGKAYDPSDPRGNQSALDDYLGNLDSNQEIADDDIPY